MCAGIQSAEEPAQVWLCDAPGVEAGPDTPPEAAVTSPHCYLGLPWGSTWALSAHLIK